MVEINNPSERERDPQEVTTEDRERGEGETW